MAHEHLKSFQPGYIARQLEAAREGVREWPSWMIREAKIKCSCGKLADFDNVLQEPYRDAEDDPCCLECHQIRAMEWRARV